jgi:hypothetical protein
MREGSYSVSGTVWRFLGVGLSWQSLWFQPEPREDDANPQRVEIVEYLDGGHNGRFCESCGTAVLSRL